MKLRLRMGVTTLAVAVPLFIALVWINQGLRRQEFRTRLELELLTQMLGGGRQRCEAAPATWSELIGHERGPPGSHHPRAPGEPPMGPGWSPPPPPPEMPDPGEGPPRAMPGERGPDGPRRQEGPGREGPRGPPPLPTRLFAYDAALRSMNPGAPALPVDAATLVASSSTGAVQLPWPNGRSALLVKMPWSEGPCAFVFAVVSELPHGHPLPPLDLWLIPLAAALLGLMVSLGPPVRRLRRLTEQVRASAKSGDTAALATEGTDEIAELARAFADAQGALREEKRHQEMREAALRNFLANTTHDVMTPLTALQSHLAQLARTESAGLREEATAAADEAHYIASLLQNLAIAAKLESGRVELVREPVDLTALISRAVGRHATIARQHEVALDRAVPPEPVIVEGDVTLLEQAVSNVIGNAVHYNARGGHVAVVLERSGDERFSLKVIDDGPGIDEASRAKILERGFRTDAARTRIPGGQGLGLDIAQEVCRRHGFGLELRRSEYGGLEVEFSGRCKPNAET